MARAATGQVVEKRRQRGTVYALRFRACGARQYVTLGSAAEGWNRDRAEQELANVLADVRRGLWRPATPESVPEPPTDPTFHEFSSEWFAEQEPGWRENTRAEARWMLTLHLLPFFHAHKLSQITVAEVDRYRTGKVREGRLSATSINRSIMRLGQVLDTAWERDLIASNPVRKNPKKRKLKVHAPARPYLDRAEQIAALLDAAADVDAASERIGRERIGRRAMVATLTLGGLRVGEMCALRWRDVDLAAGRLTVGEAKTDAGRRQVELLPLLRDELLSRKAATGGAPNSYVFATGKGRPRDRHNVRERVVKRAAALASERMVQAGGVPLPALTPHALRRTFASVLVALGRDPSYVMGQLGHTDPAFTLRVYAQLMRQGDGDRHALQALVEGVDWAPLGTTGAEVASGA